jgi:hypothetical protein
MRKKIIRRKWTTEDVKQLKSLARKRTSTTKIAKALKRTPGAVQQQAFTRGISLDTRQ